jgi:HK97 family phage major capsid protein
MTEITRETLSAMTAAQLRTAMKDLVAEATRLHYDESGEIRKFKSADEQAAFDEAMELHDRATSMLRVREAYERNPRAVVPGATFASPAFHPSHPGVDPGDVLRLAPQEARSDALRMLEDADHLAAAAQDRVETLLRTTLTAEQPNLSGEYLARRMLITESPAYRSGFARALADGQRGRAALLEAEEVAALRALDRLETVEARAVGIVSTTSGGFGVPVTIDPTIVLTAQQSGTELVRISRVETITTDRWKGVSSDGSTWSFDAEAAEVSDDSPTLAQPEVKVGMAHGFVPYSIEVGSDYPNFVEEISRVLAEGYLELLAENLIQGAGTNNGPIGIATALEANTAVTALVVTTASAFPVADVYRIWDALPKRARRQASWLSSQDTQNKVRQFGAATAGSADANFTVDLQQDSVQRLFGREYVVDDYMDDLPASGTAARTVLIVGNFQRFVIAQRAGMSVEPVQHLFGLTNNRPTGQRGLFAWARVGSDSIDDASFRGLFNKTS